MLNASRIEGTFLHLDLTFSYNIEYLAKKQKKKKGKKEETLHMAEIQMKIGVEEQV